MTFDGVARYTAAVRRCRSAWAERSRFWSCSGLVTSRGLRLRPFLHEICRLFRRRRVDWRIQCAESSGTLRALAPRARETVPQWGAAPGSLATEYARAR